MKKVFLIAIALLICSNVYAYNPVQQAGHAYTVVTKDYTSATGTEYNRGIWSPGSGAKIVLMGINFSTNAATTFRIIDTDGNIVIPDTSVLASGTVAIGNEAPIWRGGTDKSLYLYTYSVNAVDVHSILLWGYED